MARVGVRDVAAQAGVSVGTVSHVLNHPEKVSADTVDRVNTAIAALGFVRNAAASQLRTGRSLTLGAIVLDAANPFFADLIIGAEDQADGTDHSVVIGSSGADAGRERRYLSLFEEQGVDGILISPVGKPQAHLQRIVGRGTPVVLVDAEVADGSLPSVAVDDVAGGRIAAEHLITSGRSRLAFVGGPNRLRQVKDRWRGASQAVKTAGGTYGGADHGLADRSSQTKSARRPAPTLARFESSAMTVLAGRAVGQRIAALPVGRRPDAVFCANDLLAVGLMQALINARIAIPDEIALIGYDDIDFAQATMVALTSVSQPAKRLGATAVDMLLGITPPDNVRFTPELVVRDSTG